MAKKPRVILTLTGGLGNQLFQLAAALSVRKFPGEKIGLDWGIGRPRLNKLAVPDLASFNLPNGVSLLPKRRFSWLASKSNGYLLRMGFAPKSFERVAPIRFIIRTAGNLVATMYFRSKRVSYVCDSLGFSPILDPESPFVLIGYFQSYIYAEKSGVLEELRKMKPVESSVEIDNLTFASSAEKPLVVHFRFGDYKNENAFGIPSVEYYRKGITELWKTGNYKSIWVFSDEIDLAKLKFPQEYISYVRWIEEIGESAGLTLEAMRLGHGFVIANSSFSFWGAMLAHGDTKVEVVAPDPWFQGTESPNELVPNYWLRIQA